MDIILNTTINSKHYPMLVYFYHLFANIISLCLLTYKAILTLTGLLQNILAIIMVVIQIVHINNNRD